MDEQGHTSEAPFGEESAVLDKIINWGVCGIAGIAVVVVAILVIRQQGGSPAPTPTQATTNGGASGQVSPLTAATIERPAAGTTGGAKADPAAEDGPPKRPLVRDQKPKEVEVPVVVEVREHRNTAKSGGDDGGR
ncbi:MAG: hypothetical protein KDA20_09000 [Phycisphaerales bacterium]|nr:hypothetical protein [Phycisphaerales bacterium]